MVQSVCLWVKWVYLFKNNEMIDDKMKILNFAKGIEDLKAVLCTHEN